MLHARWAMIGVLGEGHCCPLLCLWAARCPALCSYRLPDVRGRTLHYARPAGILCRPHRSSLVAMPCTACCCPSAGLMVPDLLGAPLTLLPELVSARLLPFTLGALTVLFVPELIRAQYRLKQRNANQRAWPGGLLDPLGGCLLALLVLASVFRNKDCRTLSQLVWLQCGVPLKLLFHWPLSHVLVSQGGG